MSEKMVPADSYEESLNSLPKWARIRHKLREPIAECMGTMVLILFGDGVVAQVVLSGGTKGDYQSISWGWGIGVMMGVYISGGISGGHLNPAVTLANCIFRGFPWKKLPVYAFAQFLGAFIAAFIVYGNYKSAFDNFEGHGIRTVIGPTASAGVFCTYPAPFMVTVGEFFSEVIASSLLIMVIFAINDSNNIEAGPLAPLILFFLIFGIGACFGWQTGYAINPARDFGPRLASYILGYGPKVFTAYHTYFWIPIVAPCFGCSFGGFLYDLLLYTGTESPMNKPYFGLKRPFQRNDEELQSNARGDHILAGHVHGHSFHPTLENVGYDDQGREVVSEYRPRHAHHSIATPPAEVQHVERPDLAPSAGFANPALIVTNTGKDRVSHIE